MEDFKVNRGVTKYVKLQFFLMFDIWELQYKNDSDLYIIQIDRQTDRQIYVDIDIEIDIDLFISDYCELKLKGMKFQRKQKVIIFYFASDNVNG